MNSHISRTSTFSAPVVQSRLEHHHHQQQMTEARNQFHQRSKSLNNKGKRGFSYSHQQKVKETTISSSSSSDYSRNTNKNFSNYNNFDSKTSTSNRPTRRHQHSDSVDEDKFRVVPVVSILKRPQSATDFVKSSNTKSVSSLDVTKEEQIVNNYRSNSWEKSSPQQRSQSKERRRSDVTPSRSKHTQRKEIKSIGYETDLVLNNQQLSGSCDESDEGMNSNKKEDTYSNSDDNITIKSSLANKNYIESTPRRLSSTAIELQSPTFHNSPAPSDLPMPSFFGKSSLPKESSPLSVNNLFTVPENMSSVQSSQDNYSSPSSGSSSDDEIFSMDELEPPKGPYYYSQTSTLRKQTSQELLRILSATNTRQHQTAAAYMVPERMATAHNPMHVYPSNDLNELSENLRSLLKIHGQ
ncbi:7072_t:CDS:2 [Rhizophagus irregularis]|nr:7072_t:CDS:2 [Rhizophagus irregularis]